MTCGSPACCPGLSEKVARPSGAQVISDTPGAGLDACDLQPGPEHAACQVGHELAGDDRLEPRSRLGCELLPVALEPPRDLEGMHF
jgi:hypothetical protein